MKKANRPSGDLRNEFEREARAHLDALYTSALRLTRSECDAEDLVQDTLIRAYRFYDRFEPGTNLKAWLLRIQMNAYVNRYRRASRERKVFDGPMAEPVGESVMSRATMRGLTDPVGTAQRALIAQEIEEAFEDLSADARTIVLLADVHELSYKEIADVVGCPIGTVMSRLHRARKHLQGALQRQAEHLGIVADSDPDVEDPISLDEFRKQRASQS